LELLVTKTSSAEILATKNRDGSVVVMIVDRAVHAATDNNGASDPRTVIVDVSAPGPFSSATTTRRRAIAAAPLPLLSRQGRKCR
jgi:hypothetical protein